MGGGKPHATQSPIWMDRFLVVRQGKIREVEPLTPGAHSQVMPRAWDSPRGVGTRSSSFTSDKHLHLPLAVLNRVSAEFFFTIQDLCVSLSDQAPNPPSCSLPVFGEFLTFHRLNPQPFPWELYTFNLQNLSLPFYLNLMLFLQSVALRVGWEETELLLVFRFNLPPGKCA